MLRSGRRRPGCRRGNTAVESRKGSGGNMVQQHLSSQLSTDLNAVRLNILEMGGMVELMIAHSTSSVTERDSALAQRTIASDQAIDRLEMEIDEKCFQLLARRHPAAKDLRLTTMALKTVTD